MRLPPIGTVVATVPHPWRKRIAIGVKAAGLAVILFAPETTKWRRIQLGIDVVDVVIYEFDAIANDDDVEGDSISATNRWLYDRVADTIGEKPTAAVWTAALERLIKWYGPHIMRRVAESMAN